MDKERLNAFLKIPQLNTDLEAKSGLSDTRAAVSVRVYVHFKVLRLVRDTVFVP